MASAPGLSKLGEELEQQWARYRQAHREWERTGYPGDGALYDSLVDARDRCAELVDKARRLDPSLADRWVRRAKEEAPDVADRWEEP